MKAGFRVATFLPFFAWLTCASVLFAETKNIEFQGRVTAIDVAAKTISIRARQKEFVFSIDPQRCKIVKEGQPGALSSAEKDDAVVGDLQTDEGGPVVTRLFLTARPETGVRIKEKPGFISSPYNVVESPRPPTEGRGAIDVRGYQRGSMLVDYATGKIFLVP